MGKQAKNSYSFINLIAVVACFGVIVVILSVLLANFMFEKSVEEDASDVSGQTEKSAEVSSDTSKEIGDTSEESLPAETSGEEPKPVLNYETHLVPYSDIHKGNLIVVNENQRFDFANTPKLGTIYNHPDYNGDYKLRNLELQISFDILPSLNSMLSALKTYTGSNALTVTYGFRNQEAAPGDDDLNTGLSFMCTVYPAEEGNLSDGKFTWLAENCSKYGFILRYPNGKKSLTLHDGSDSVFRYVGRPHAFLMKLNNQCLEEYIDFCKRFTYDNYYPINSDGKRYYIYYVKANPSGNTEIKVPENCDYDISGDNSEGFIVTVMAGLVND